MFNFFKSSPRPNNENAVLAFCGQGFHNATHRLSDLTYIICNWHVSYIT